MPRNVELSSESVPSGENRGFRDSPDLGEHGTTETFPLSVQQTYSRVLDALSMVQRFLSSITRSLLLQDPLLVPRISVP